jgi:hypothetical protein
MVGRKFVDGHGAHEHYINFKTSHAVAAATHSSGGFPQWK